MKQRTTYFDYLRVIAIISVIVLHVAAQKWHDLSVRSIAWNICNFYDAITRWGVPIFVMISGSLFLSKEVKIRSLYTKNIARLAVAYFIWSALYAIVIPVTEHLISGSAEISLTSIIENVIGGHYHLWFIPMIIGLYMCVPIIKEIVISKSIMKYFLLLSFIFAFLIPQTVIIADDFIGGRFTAGLIKAYSVIYGKMQLVLGYSSYFVLGYYLNTIDLSPKKRSVIYVLGLISVIATVALSALVSWKTNSPNEDYFDCFRVNVLLMAIAVHTWFKYKKYPCSKLNSFVSVLSKCSFGAYLVHVFVIFFLEKVGIDTLLFSPIMSVPIISLVVMVISFSTSWVLHKIPIINKWLV
jgi:surface polysaccharide O-acyltransferase-like enzyme